MARNRRTKRVAPLQTIAKGDLDQVIGGRIAIPKGPSPELIQGIQGLVEATGALGQKRQADQAQSAQVMQQMMGMMQQKQGGR
jgi:hypothetical protein